MASSFPSLRFVHIGLLLGLAAGACASKSGGTTAAGIVAADDTAAAPTDNPFVGAKMWIDPDSVASGLSRRWRKDRPEDAALMEKMAGQPAAFWVGDWVPDVGNYVTRQTRKMARGGFLPVYVVYNIPKRDCGQYSKGGASAADEYQRWISSFAKGIGDRRAVVIIEPDALAALDQCLDAADQEERLSLIRYAVSVFAGLGNTYVYLDAGHSDWVPAEEMARRLKAAGVARATGFALNVSNYKATADLVSFGTQVSQSVGGKPFILDTSRNGNGPPSADAAGEGSWCNPHGRALGATPTADTGNPLVHAFLWIKKPGESDGECNGGPKAGVFWPDMALELARGGS